MFILVDEQLMLESDMEGTSLLATLLEVLAAKFSQLDEVGIIPGVPPQSSSCDRNGAATPVAKDLMVVMDTRLGLYSGTLKQLFLTAYTRLMALRRGEVSTGAILGDDTAVSQLASLSRVVVLLCGECMVAWTIRKRLVRDGFLCGLCDLKLASLSLGIYAKSPETFIHKRYLTSFLLASDLTSVVHPCGQDHGLLLCGTWHSSAISPSPTQTPPLSSADAAKPSHSACTPSCQLAAGLIRQELRGCTSAADGYRHNYAAWRHRIWLIHQLVNASICCKTAICSVVSGEFSAVSEWISSNVSQYSAMYYLAQLLHFVAHVMISMQLSSLVGAVLQPHIDSCASLLTLYPEHEALWCYRQELIRIALLHGHTLVPGCSLGLGTSIAAHQDGPGSESHRVACSISNPRTNANGLQQSSCAASCESGDNVRLCEVPLEAVNKATLRDSLHDSLSCCATCRPSMAHSSSSSNGTNLRGEQEQFASHDHLPSPEGHSDASSAMCPSNSRTSSSRSNEACKVLMPHTGSPLPPQHLGGEGQGRLCHSCRVVVCEECSFAESLTGGRGMAATLSSRYLKFLSALAGCSFDAKVSAEGNS